MYIGVKYVKCIQVLNMYIEIYVLYMYNVYSCWICKTYTDTEYVQCRYVINMYSIRMMKFLKGKIREISFKK